MNPAAGFPLGRSESGLVHLGSAIVTHYRRDRRDLPWRQTRDPYAIWVSEIMLQQTRVQTVIPYWQRWMQKFPTVRDLAAAPLDDVLAAWAGLGYYSRARNLWNGAREVSEKYAGALPGSATELRNVPGIGPYTAGAIASIAFGERTPLVDGNVARVLARVTAMPHDIKSTAGTKALWAHAGELMSALPDEYTPGELNQGLMELGATLCSPTQPKCLVCPLHTLCAAARAGTQDSFPIVAARKKESELPILARAALWIEHGGQIVLARREPKGLFGGLWELPQGGTVLEIAGALGVTTFDAEPVAYHDQTLSHRRLRVAVYRARSASLVVGTVPGYDAITRVGLLDAAGLGIAAATSAILTKYKDTPWTSTPKPSLSSPRATKRSSRGSKRSATTSTTRTSAKRPPAPRRGSTSSSTTRSRSSRRSTR